MSGRPQDSLYGSRVRTPPSPHPVPNNIGVVLLVIVLLAIVAGLALVLREVAGEVRHIVYCIDRAQEAICA